MLLHSKKLLLASSLFLALNLFTIHYVIASPALINIAKGVSKIARDTAIYIAIQELYGHVESEISKSIKLMYQTFSFELYKKEPENILVFLDKIEEDLKVKGQLTPELALNISQIRKTLKQKIQNNKQ